MTYAVSISYDTSKRSTDRKAYSTTIYKSVDQFVPLHSIGPTTNNVVRYLGVYLTRKEAAKAAREYRGF